MAMQQPSNNDFEWLKKTVAYLNQQIQEGFASKKLDILLVELSAIYRWMLYARPHLDQQAMQTCVHQTLPGAQYCVKCGAPTHPALLVELHWMYETTQRLTSLDESARQSTTIEQWNHALTDMMAATTAANPQPAQPPYAASTYAAPKLTAPPPPRQTFSWRALLAEQSIAIIAYTGGFLLLIATLLLEIGSVSPISDTGKLIAVCVVYVVFGIAGLGLGFTKQLSTISKVYLAIFGLMTPLVALAVYRYALLNIGIPASGTVCITAFYAGVLYFVLARQSKMESFSYLGAVSIVVGTSAAIPWLQLSFYWWPTALCVGALLLLAPRLLHWNSSLRRPAQLIGVLAIILAVPVIGNEDLSIFATTVANCLSCDRISLHTGYTISLIAVLLTAGAWALSLHDSRYNISSRYIDIADIAFYGLAAQAAIGIAYRFSFDLMSMSLIISSVGIIELVSSFVISNAAPGRKILRSGVEILSLGLSFTAYLQTIHQSDPNWPGTIAMSAVFLSGAALAISRRQAWWTVASGLALTFIVHTSVIGIFNLQLTGPQTLQHDIAQSILHFSIMLVVWVLAMTFSWNAGPLKKLVWPLAITALANALYLLMPLISANIDIGWKLAAWNGIGVMAIITGWKQKESIFTSIVYGLFGVIAIVQLQIFPATANIAPSMVAAQLWIGGMMPAIAAVIIRLVTNRNHAYAPYIIATLTILFTAPLLSQTQIAAPQPFDAMGLTITSLYLFANASLAFIVVALEDLPIAMIVPALFWTIGLLSSGGEYSRSILLLLLAIIGLALRQWRGRWWDISAYGFAAFTSLSIVLQETGTDTPTVIAKVILLAGIAIIGYIAILLDNGYLETIIASSVMIFLPMVVEVFSASPAWIYTIALAFESVAMLMIGLGMKSRAQQVFGSAVLIITVIRAVALAYESGAPIALLIGALAVVLMVLATVLSVRNRNKAQLQENGQ